MLHERGKSDSTLYVQYDNMCSTTTVVLLNASKEGNKRKSRQQIPDRENDCGIGL
jgi:hypothetical protein